MKYLADRTQRIDSSGIRKVFALATQLKDPVNFSIGQPDFDVPGTVKEAAIEAIRNGYNSYSQTAGTPEIVDCLKRKVSNDYGWKEPYLMLTDGVSGGLLLAFMALINPGDEAVLLGNILTTRSRTNPVLRLPAGNSTRRAKQNSTLTGCSAVRPCIDSVTSNSSILLRG